MPTVTIGENTGDDFSGSEATQLREAQPTTNFSSSGTMEITKFEAADHTHAVIRVSGISSLPGSLSVSSATLSLYQSDSDASYNIEAKKLARVWVDGEVTWNIWSTGNNWSTPGAINEPLDRSATPSFDQSVGSATGQYYNLSAAQLAADVEDFADGTLVNDGWHLARTDSGDDSTFKVFNTEGGSDGTRPSLSVTFTSGGVDNLEADGISVSPEVGNPVVGQEHALTATGITATPVVGTPTLGQVHALAATGIATGAPTLGTPTLSESHILTAAGIATGAPVAGTPSIGQAHALAATGITADPVLGTPTIAQVHALAATGIATGAPTLGNPVLAEGVDNLTALGIATGAPVLGTPTLEQVHALIASGIATGAPVVGNPTLAVNVDALVAAGIVTTPVLGNPILAQVHALVAAGITVAPVLGTPTLFEGGAVGLATMTFTTKIPGITFASAQPRIDITDE